MAGELLGRIDQVSDVDPELVKRLLDGFGLAGGLAVQREKRAHQVRVVDPEFGPLGSRPDATVARAWRVAQRHVLAMRRLQQDRLVRLAISQHQRVAETGRQAGQRRERADVPGRDCLVAVGEGQISARALRGDRAPQPAIDHGDVHLRSGQQDRADRRRLHPAIALVVVTQSEVRDTADQIGEVHVHCPLRTIRIVCVCRRLVKGSSDRGKPTPSHGRLHVPRATVRSSASRRGRCSGTGVWRTR